MEVQYNLEFCRLYSIRPFKLQKDNMYIPQAFLKIHLNNLKCRQFFQTKTD